MKKYLALVKLLFVQQYKARPDAEGKGKKKRAGTVVAFVVLGLALLPFLLSLATAMYFMGAISNGNVYIATFLTLICQGLVLTFGVHTIISNVFVVKDADRLLYLPVRSHTIFLAKLTVAYLNEVITTAVTMIVLLLPFGLGSGAGVAYYAMLLCALFLIPLLPMLVGCLVAMPFTALIAQFSKNSAIKTVLRIVLYVVIMAVYMYAMYNFGFMTSTENGSILDNPETFIPDMIEGFIDRLNPVMSYFHPNFALANSMLATSFTSWLLYFLIAVGENIALLAIVIVISLPFYTKMLSGSLEGIGVRKGKTNTQQKLQNRGIVRELVATDFKRTVRDGQLGFQSFAGIIMMPIIVVILFFFMGLSEESDASVLEVLAVSPLYQIIAPIAILLYMTLIGIGTNVLGLYPISRENKSVYMLKSLPIDFGKILLAKVLLATAVMVISDFITCTLIVVLMGIKWYYGIAMLIAMALIGFGSMCITTLLDLKSPKIGWTNFNQSLKNAKNTWIAMLIGLLTMVGVLIISVGFMVWYAATEAWYVALMMWVLIIGASVGFVVIAYATMLNKANKYFQQIEV